MAIDLPPATMQFIADELNKHGIVNEDEAKVSSPVFELHTMEVWRTELRALPRPYKGGALRPEVYQPKTGGLYALVDDDRMDSTEALAVLANYLSP